MPLIRARSSSLIDSLDLRGSPTAPTAAAGANTTQVATTAFVSTGITNLVSGAPGILDTLAELATSLANDADFSTTITNALAGKVAKAGDSMSGFLTLHADPSSNLHAATKQYVDGEINSQMIYSTDDVSEGSNNQYYLASRVFADLTVISDNASVFDYNGTTGVFTYAHPTSDGILEGSTNQYYTDARARGAVSLTSSDATVLAYSSATGAFTFTRQDTDKTTEGTTNLYFTTARARNALSGGNNISYDTATGIISSTAAVTSVNGMTGVVVIGTDDVDEGSSNLYFTNARAQSAISLTTNDSNMLDYNSGTGAFTFVKPTTDSITEGTSNLYYTNTRVRNAISTSGWANLSYDSVTGVISISAPDTDDVTEGANLYYTNARAQAAVSAVDAGGDGSFAYDSATGAFTYTGPSATEARAHFSAATSGTGWGGLSYAAGVFTYAKVTDANIRQALSAATSGTGFGGLSYDLATGAVTFAKVTAADVRGNLSAVTSGDGSLTYDSATGAFTYTGPSSAEQQAHFSAATSGTGFGGLTYASGVFTYAKVTASDVRGNLSATTASGVTYNSATGVIALASIPNASLTNSEITVNGATISLGGSATLDADDIAEAVSGTNKYFTDARWDTRLATKSTTDLAEGSNLYYTTARFDTRLATKSTTNLAEGSNLYYTTARTRADVSGGTGVTYTAGTGVFEIGQAVGTTSDVTFNNMTVAGNLTVNGTVTAVNSTTVDIADINITIAKGAADATAANGAGLTVDGASATLIYASANDNWNFNKSVAVTGGLSVTTTMTAPTFTGNLTGNVTGNVTGNLTGNADTTTTLATSRNIQGVSFNGSADITVVTAGTGVTVNGTSVAIGQAVGTGSSVTFAGVTAPLTGNVTGQVSDISNHDTSDLTEDPAATVSSGTMYFTEARARGAVSGVDAGGDGSFAYDSATGGFTYTGPSATEARAHFSAATSGTGFGGLTYAAGVFTYAKVTASDVRGNLSAVTSGDGSLTYDSATGVYTYTGPSSAEQQAHFSAATSGTGWGGLTYDSATGVFTYAKVTDANIRQALSASTASGVTYNSTTGVIALASIPNGSLTNSEITVNGYATALGASVTLDSDDVNEGASNLYFTNARVQSAISLTSDAQTVLAYDGDTGVFTFTLANTTTDEVAEGSTNQYFLTSRARNSISVSGAGTYDSATGIINVVGGVSSVNGATGVVVIGTDDVNEGASNLYFTNARAQSAISLTSDDANILAYNSGTGVLTYVTPTTDAIDEGAVNLYYTNDRADARIAAASVGALSDVDLTNGLQDGYTLVWSSAAQNFVPQNIAVTATTLNFTGDGSATSFSTGVEVSSIDNTQVFVNGLIQAPTYSYSINTVSSVTSIVFTEAPDNNDYIFVRVSSTSTLTAGGILNEQSNIDGGTY